MFKSIEREGKNSSIQGTNADIIKRAIYLIWRDGEQYGIKQMNTVHDENVLLAPKTCSKEAFEFAGRCMEAGWSRVCEVFEDDL
jgi:DNA polymerase I-like protein with 3'-5' exonuclease and polymerase domains